MINIPPASFRLTPYGEVDAVALENLRDSFDTSQLLRLVDRLDLHSRRATEIACDGSDDS